MCKVILNQLRLGARELGWEAWDGRQVVELTSNQIIKALKDGEDIRGLQLSENGELELDQKFFTRNIMVKSHINNYKPLVEEDGDLSFKVFYIILGSRTTESGIAVYKAVTTRFAQEELTEEKLKALYDLGAISAGVKIEGDRIILPSIHTAPVVKDAVKVQDDAGQAEPETPRAKQKASAEKKDTSK